MGYKNLGGNKGETIDPNWPKGYILGRVAWVMVNYCWKTDRSVGDEQLHCASLTLHILISFLLFYLPFLSY